MPDIQNLTVAQIQEIYLQIKGSRPGQIPPRDVMGYSAAQVIGCLKAIERKEARKWAETVRIRAAALAFCLDRGAPFRDQNRQVALQAAVLFLIINNFRISKNDPPKNYFSEQNLLAWLNEISEAP